MQVNAPQAGHSRRGHSIAFLVAGASAMLPGLGYWLAVIVTGFYERPDFVPVIWPILRPVLSASLVLSPVAISIALFTAVRGLKYRSKTDGISSVLWSLSAVLFASIFLHYFAEAGAGL